MINYYKEFSFQIKAKFFSFKESNNVGRSKNNFKIHVYFQIGSLKAHIY